jgi:hypothetical protein
MQKILKKIIYILGLMVAVIGIGNETKAAESCDCGCEGEVHIFYDDSDEVPYDVLVNYNADSDTFCVPIMIGDTFYADSEHKRYARNEFIEFMKDYDYEYADSQTALITAYDNMFAYKKTYRMKILVAPGVNVDIHQTKEYKNSPYEYDTRKDLYYSAEQYRIFNSPVTFIKNTDTPINYLVVSYNPEESYGNFYWIDDKQNDKCNEQVDKIVRGMKGDTYEKLIYAYQWFGKNVKRDDLSNNYTIYNNLIDGVSNRVGFAQAFQLVMEKAGIESYIVDGGSDNRYLTVNIVKLNNKYYYIDAAEASKGMDKFLYGDNGSNAYEAWGIKVEDTGYKLPSTETPVVKPTEAPVVKPTEAPVAKPTEAPVVKPTEAPVTKPTEAPVVKPTETPMVKPTEVPTNEPEVMPDETITENTMQNVDETFQEYTEEPATKFDTEGTEGSLQLEEVHKGNSEPWIIVLLVVAVMIIVSIITAIVFLLKKR